MFDKDLIKEDILSLLRQYLNYNSLDGKRERMVFRKEMKRLLEMLKDKK